jgi:hypothetical protein
VATHVKVVAVICIVFGVLGLLLALFSSVILGLLAGLVGSSGEEGAALGSTVLGLAGAVLTTVLIVFAIPSVVAGWGLLMLKPWARILGIIVAAISLIRFPIGTIFGIYALWVLFQKDTEALFVKTPTS